MLGLIGASLGSLAKKVLKEQAVKIGKAVYERTLKPVILKLREKAIELTRKVMMDPLDANLGARLDEVEADIRTLERAEAKLPVESMGTTEESRAKSRIEDAELDRRFKTKSISGYDADKALIDAKTRAKGRVVGGRPSTIDFGSGYKESYAMKPTQSLQARLPKALEAIGGITEDSMFGVELAPIKDALEIQEENLLEARLFNSGKKLHPDGVAIRVEMQSIPRPAERHWMGDPMERAMYRASKTAVYDGGGVLSKALGPETLLEKSERMMREMGLDIEYTGKHQSAEALGTAYDKLSAETDAMQEKAFEKDFQAYRQRTMQSIAQEGVVREPQSIEMQDLRRNPDTVHEELREPLLDHSAEPLEVESGPRPSRWNRFKKKWDFLAYKERPLMDLEGVMRFKPAPVRSKFTFKDWSAGLKTRPKMTAAQKAAFTEELRTADIFVSGTGSELFVNFAKSIGSNAAMAAAMVALGFVLPKKAQKGMTYAFDALAVAELLAGNPAMAVMTGGMELWKEFGVQAKRSKYNIESDRDHGKVFGYVRDGKNWYPAFVDQHEKWHGGLGERGNDLDLVYGTELIMRVMPDGTIEPDILHPMGKRHVSGSDKDLLMSTKEVADKQSMRDWYLLGPDDMETVRIGGQDVVKPKAEMTVYEDDWSKCRTCFRDSRRRRLARSTCPRGGRPTWTCAGAWTTCTTGGSGRTTSSGSTTRASTRVSR